MPTNIKGGLNVDGVPVDGSSLPTTPGTYYYVDYGNGNDAWVGTQMDRPFKTLEYAYSKVTTNKYDVIVLMGSSTHTLAAMLTVAKNRLTIIGLDGSPGRRYGQAAKVYLGDTPVATDIATMKNTGVRNVFTNINFQNAEEVDEGLYCVAEGGEFAQYNNCNFYKSTDLDESGAAEIACNGDSSEFNNCYIGSTANAIAGAIIRPCVTFSRGLATAADGARDVSFRNCIFARKCGNAANNFLYGAEANCVERMLLIENCVFYNPLLGTTPDEAIEFGSDQTDGSVLVKDCVAINVTGIASTGQGVYVQGSQNAATTSCIAIAAT